MRRIIWLSLAVGISVTLMIGCQVSPEQIPESTPTPETPPVDGWVLPAPEWAEGEHLGAAYVSEGIIVSHTIDADSGYGSPASKVTLYVEGQVLVSGIVTDIENIVGETNDRMGARLKEGLVWDSQRDSIASGQDGTEIRRYRFTTGDPLTATVTDVVQDLRTSSANQAKLVLIDPNYLVTVKADECEDAVGGPLASSGHGEASPGHGEASPLHGPKRPFAYPDLSVPLPTYFWQQWALDDVNGGGIDVADAGQRRTDVADGAGTQIIVLDTSPFTTPGEARFGSDFITPPLTLTVEIPFTIDLTHTVPELSCLDNIDISDHGLFAAGLAHAVAPASDIKLIRVLGDDGAGDLGGILYVLHNLQQTPFESPTVLNLSLGITSDPPSPACASQKPPKEGFTGLRDWYAGLPLEDRLAQSNCLDTGSLRQVILDFQNDSNVLIAAAAGNHARVGAPLEAQLPARYGMQPPVGEGYPYVLAVAASTGARDAAFYSHTGSIAAPGGGDNDSPCADAWVGKQPGCWDEAQDFVVSITARKDGSGGLEYSLGYWEGTSFATPLVAGMAAGLFPNLSAQATAQQVLESASTTCPDPTAPATVLGAGIIRFCP